MTVNRLRWVCIGISIVFLFIAISFVSCKTCELNSEYTVAVSDANVVDMHGILWNTYSSADVSTEVMNSLRAQFGQTSNLILETGSANVHIFIDSIITDSYEWDESKTDPCYGEHGWLYQLAFPPEVHAYRLRRTNVTLVYSIVDSLHLKSGWGRASGESSEYLSQPQGDSTQCFQYEIAGLYDPQYAISGAVQMAFQNFKCEVKKMMEP